MAELQGSDVADSSTGKQTSQLRIFLLGGLLLFEVILIAFLYNPQRAGGISLYTINKVYFFGKLQPFLLLLVCIFPIFIWARYNELIAFWRNEVEHYAWLKYLGFNLILFVALLPTTLVLNKYQGNETLELVLNAAWHIGLILLFSVLLSAIAPVSFWKQFFIRFYPGVFLAVAASLFIIGIAVLSQSTWNSLSEATFELSYWILSLYEPDIFVNTVTKELSVKGFLIRIDPACSGYEGIGLIITFLSIYIIAFRKTLKFPNIFLLYVIGIPLIWVLNAVRIAFLASIGGHISPQIAVSGFHSQAGWIMFLTVTLILMFVSSQLSFFNRNARKTKDTDPAVRLAVALLAPFIAFMAASVFASAFSGDQGGEWLYFLKVVAILFALFLYRDVYIGLIEKVSWLSVAAGAFIGVLWIVTDNNPERQQELSTWLQSLGGIAFAGWVSIRLFGTIFLIPIAEELAFRSYLHRALVSKRFETVQHGQFSLLAFGVTSLLFAGMHSGRFWEALLAGALFVVLMYRTNRISDPIAAHMVANAVVGGWAVYAGQWSLL